MKKHIQKNPDYHKDGTREFKSVQSMFGPQERSLSTCDDPNVSKSDEKFKKPYIYWPGIDFFFLVFTIKVISI